MRVFHYAMAAGLALVSGALTGCDSSDHQGLKEWMDEQRKLTRPRVPPLPVPTQFKPATYDQSEAIEPFSNEKLTKALKSTQPTVNMELIAPELARRKEPLESSPLDAVVMVGSVVKGGQPMALVKVDTLIYQVRVGNYLGQNYGRITEITESSLSLREIVQDSAGEWMERPATLQLSEESKK